MVVRLNVVIALVVAFLVDKELRTYDKILTFFHWMESGFLDAN